MTSQAKDSRKGRYRINKENGKQHVIQPSVCLRQIHSGAIGSYARLYTYGVYTGQNFPKEERKTMLIDGEPATELDYSGHAFRIAYNQKGLNPEGDVYKPKKILPKFYKSVGTNERKKNRIREFVKKASNICLTVTSEFRAERAIQQQLGKSAFLRRGLREIEGITAKQLVSRLKRAHRLILDRFFCEAAAKIMTLDGEVMLDILTQFAEAGKPALGIHDAVLCKQSDAGFARRVMEQAYEARFGFPPVLKTAF